MLIVFVAGARQAQAQWFIAGQLGASATQSATVSVNVPAASFDVKFQNVEFEGRSFESPQYYAVRLGRWLDARGTVGIDFELIHLKVIAKTGAAYTTTGTVAGAPLPPTQPMSATVERYSMTHGLNFLVASVVSRRTFGAERAALLLRGGGGVTVPHTETTVLGTAVDQYEAAGFGAEGSAGAVFKLSDRWQVLAEYKFTYARPEITAASGTGRMTAITHQVAGGLAFGLWR